MQFHFSVMQPAIKQSRPCGFASGHGKEEKKKLRLQPKSDKNDDSIGCHSFFFFSFLGIHDCSFVKERSPVLSFELEQFHCGRRKKKRFCRSKKKKCHYYCCCCSKRFDFIRHHLNQFIFNPTRLACGVEAEFNTDRTAHTV